MKNKILALVLAGTMLFGQNVYATELVTPENNDVTENKNNVVQDIDKSGTEEVRSKMNCIQMLQMRIHR
mgnify:CR=1 FL=1